MNLFDMLNRKVVNGKEVYIDKHIKSSIFSKINSKTSVVLTYLNTLDGARNIKNYPEMIDALRKNDFNRASKIFYKMMPKDLESYLALDTITDEAIAKGKLMRNWKKFKVKPKRK
nr:hypothetical protein [Providencia alcalifaciens]